MAPNTRRDPNKASEPKTSSVSAVFGLVVLFLVPVAVAVLLYRAEGFEPAPLPDHHSSWTTLAVPKLNARILDASERLADGLVAGPEDLAFDPDAGVLYTGCVDGWIKKLTLAGDPASVAVENLAFTGGRPLGVALGPDKLLIIADAFKGLLRVTKQGSVDVLVDEVEGVKFRLTDGVDVAQDGLIYFTDASYKYNINDHMLDHLEGRPHGRLLRFDPQTNLTEVLVRDLYFANGVAISPKQDFLVFCETTIRRCRKYHIQGERKGLVDDFIDNLPGFPDNIRYDGDGHFWIAMPTATSLFWKILLRYPIVRKCAVILDKFMKVPDFNKDSGVMSVSLEGEADALYSDPRLTLVTGGLKIGSHLYYGSLTATYIGRLHVGGFKNPNI